MERWLADGWSTTGADMSVWKQDLSRTQQTRVDIYMNAEKKVLAKRVKK